MKRKLLLLFTAIVILSVEILAQQVPNRIEFANMDLRLTTSAIKDIQADVDALTRSEKYFLKKLERVDMYMPIIERIFQEEGLPEDFKYLVIQESALVSDAVSSSNAVGFWQFKEISGLENDLRIDRQVDERMNIVSSSRAAAAYLKSHNEYFDNWAYALIAYQRGRGGAADVIDDDNFGNSRLKITSDTYWYLKKFLAHKVAFENALRTSNPPFYLKEIENVQGQALKHIAKEEGVPLELLEEYNKWIRKGKVPEDKNYTVIVPLSNLDKIEKVQTQKKMALEELPGNIDDNKQQNFPLVDNYPSRSDRSVPYEVEINGLDGIYAPAGFTVKKLAEVAGIDEYKFRKFNDLNIRDELKTGKIYYLRRKRNRAKFYYHTVAQNENMWGISQKYGLKLKKLYRKNRMTPTQEPKEGRVLWLRHNRPADVPIEYREAPSQATPEQNDNNQDIEKTITSESQKSPVQPLSIEKEEVAIDSVAPKDSVIVQDSVSMLPSEQFSQEIITNQPDSISAVEDSLSVQDSLISRNEEITLQEESSEPVMQDDEDEDELNETNDIDEGDFTEYSIKKGDTFFSISNRFNMKISTLLNVNNLGIRDTLSIGQIIKVNKDGYIIESPQTTEKIEEQKTETIPATSEVKSSEPEIEHKVAPGDTMYALAKKYNVSLKEIMDWNNKQDYALKEGELILIKRK